MSNELGYVDQRIDAETYESLQQGDRWLLVGFVSTTCKYCDVVQPILEDAARRLPEVKVVTLYREDAAAVFDAQRLKGVPMLGLYRFGGLRAAMLGSAAAPEFIEQVSRIVAA